MRLVNYAKYVFRTGFTGAFSRITGISLNKPSIITFDITDRCQLRCLTCTKWKTPPEVQSSELTTNGWKEILLALKSWIGDFSFIFSGGQPFLRKDLLEICTFAARNHLHPKVITNGCGFHNLTGEIIESGLEQVIISLNGINSQTHDVTRGVEGAFAKTERFIDELNKLKRSHTEKSIKLIINTILLPINYNEAIDLVNWVQEEGIDYIHFQPMDPVGSFHSYPIQGTDPLSLKGANGDWYRQNLEETTNRNLELTVRRLIKMKEEGYRIQNSVEDLRRIVTFYNNPLSVRNRCPLGECSFNIDPYGYVRFCFDMNTIGNIQKNRPRSLFNNRKALEFRQQIRSCHKTCHWAVC